jgi:hypothetical protein
MRLRNQFLGCPSQLDDLDTHKVDTSKKRKAIVREVGCSRISRCTFFFPRGSVRSDDDRTRDGPSGNVGKDGRSPCRIDPLRRLNARCRNRSQGSQIFQALPVEINENYLASRATAY